MFSFTILLTNIFVDVVFQLHPIPKSSAIILSSFKFDDLYLTEDETVLGSVRIFVDAGLVEAFKIDTKVLIYNLFTVTFRVNLKRHNTIFVMSLNCYCLRTW